MFILRYSFIQDQDPTILAFLPMTKAAYKGMDAVSDFCVDKGHPKIEKFMIAGFSKRGWTTWLTVNEL
jgi:PhoPQ-activated pathogenicity-related protein